MILKNFPDINIYDFQNLIDNGVAESKTIEYKKDIKLTQDGEKKEFLYDVSSFCNAIGGDLIFGISEDRSTGLPETLEGIEIANNDELLRKIESLIRDGIQPRIAGVSIKSYQLNNLKYILLIRIPKSWQSPHQVIFQGADKFYTRGANGKYKLDVNELRNAFILSDTVTERVRKFREERLSKIISNETPISLLNNAKIAVQFIPISSFEPNKLYDITTIEPVQLVPLGGGGWNTQYNLDGRLTYTQSSASDNAKSYIQLFRNGIIETVNAYILKPYDGEKMIPSVSGLDFEILLINLLQDCAGIINTLKIELPIYIYITFIGVKGYYLQTNKLHSSSQASLVDRDILLLPELVMEKYQIDIPGNLRQLFDMIWNACGYERSLNYDATGKWVGVK